jgi:hypothetical protein
MIPSPNRRGTEFGAFVGGVAPIVAPAQIGQNRACRRVLLSLRAPHASPFAGR